MRVASFILAFPLLASAAVLPRQTTGNCNTGTLQCCSSVQSSSTTTVTQLAGLLGIDLTGITGLIGLTCSPLSVLGVGGNSCSAQPACCTGNTFGGLITLGCSPVNLNL